MYYLQGNKRVAKRLQACIKTKKTARQTLAVTFDAARYSDRNTNEKI